MDYKEIQELIKLVNRTEIAEFKYETADYKIAIRTKTFSDNRLSNTNVVPVQVPVTTQVPAPQPSQVSTTSVTNSKEDSNESTENFLVFKSPMVGTFYRSPSPDKPSFAKVGEAINQGDVICIIEAMKLFNEIESEFSGKIVKILAEDASPVEFDQPLFLIDPKG